MSDEREAVPAPAKMEYRLIENETRFYGVQYAVHMILGARSCGFKEFRTREQAEAFIASRTQ